MGLTEKKKRDYLISIIQNHLETAKSLMEYYKAVAETRKAKLTCTKSIKNIDEAIVHLRQIKHIELLDYLYSSFIGNNAIAYSISGSLVLSPKLKYFDTEEGFVEFKDTMEKQKQERLEKERKAKEEREVIERAKAEGKKVESVWDKDTKTLKTTIVEEKADA